MVPDFETGDMLITVKMMKQGYKVGYYTDIKVQTTVPKTVSELFKQRRRWERGTIKVLVNEKGFYLKQFKNRKILAVQTVLNLSFPLLVLAGITAMPFSDLKQNVMGVFESYVFWIVINSVKLLQDSFAKKEGDRTRILKWFFLQGLVYTAIVAPARLTGIYDAIKYFVSNKITQNSNISSWVRTKIDELLENNSSDTAVENPSDRASLSFVRKQSAPGGIDLTPANMNLQTQNLGGSINLHLDPAMLQQLRNTPGFVPIIINIQPMTDLRIFLGLEKNNPSAVS